MQIEIALTNTDEKILECNYHHALSSALYHLLTQQAPQLATQLHDGASRSRLKLFVFSPLNSDPKPEIAPGPPAGFQMGKRLWMRLSSIVPEILFALSEGLLKAGTLQIQNKRFKVEKIDMVRPPDFQSSTVYRPFGQSGMIVCRYSTGERTVFRFPGDKADGYLPGCAELMAANLRHKLLRMKEVRPDILENILSAGGLSETDIKTTPVQIEFLPLTAERPYRTGYYTIKSAPVRAFRAPVRLTAPEPFHRVVWECGLGSLNSQGFGLMTFGKQED